MNLGLTGSHNHAGNATFLEEPLHLKRRRCQHEAIPHPGLVQMVDQRLQARVIARGRHRDEVYNVGACRILDAFSCLLDEVRHDLARLARDDEAVFIPVVRRVHTFRIGRQKRPTAATRDQPAFGGQLPDDPGNDPSA